MTSVLFVRPPQYGRRMAGRRWNPWRALRERDHIELVFADIPAGTDGAWFPFGPTSTIVLDVGLDRIHRNATLAHEVIHDERGISYPLDAPAALVAKEERAVDLEVARRLVPLDELERFCLARATVGAVSVHDVADEFEVPPDVAARAMRMLRRTE